jgi:di/tripeptidase
MREKIREVANKYAELTGKETKVFFAAQWKYAKGEDPDFTSEVIQLMKEAYRGA